MPARRSANDFLAIYLNDHFAGSMAGLQLARRAQAHNEGTELGRDLSQICTEIEAERETLRQLMVHLEIGESTIKPAGAWLLERLGRLKLNGQLRGYSPLSRVVELEGLCTGVTGKMLLWKAMVRSFGSDLDGFDFEALAERAAAQLARLDSHRLDAAKRAFAGGASPAST